MGWAGAAEAIVAALEIREVHGSPPEDICWKLFKKLLYLATSGGLPKDKHLMQPGAGPSPTRLSPSFTSLK